MIHIRSAERADIKAVHGLITELAVYEKEPDAVVISAEDLERHGFDQHRFTCFVAEDSEAKSIVGMALFYERYSTWKGPTVHLEDLYVQPAHRGSGIGRLLFDRVVKAAAERKAGRMEWTVLEWNEPAKNFYKTYNANLDPEWHLGTLTQEQIQRFL